MPHEQRGLQRDGHRLHDPPGTELDVLEVGELVAQAAGEPGHLAARRLHFGEERLHRLRRAHHAAQHVEAVDVAGALPDRVERHLAVEPRHARELHVAVPAQALERLRHVPYGALADPVLGHGKAEALERVALVAGAR